MSGRCGFAPRGRGQEYGFTLIEAVVAISVVVVGLLGIFQVLGSSILTNQEARNRSLATHFAEKQLEVVRNTSFASLVSVGETTDPELTALSSDATWERIVTPVGSGTMVAVTIVVRWTQQQQPQELSLSTTVHRDGINSIHKL